MTYIGIFTIGIALVAFGLSLVAYGLWGIKAKAAPSGVDSTPTGTPPSATGVDPSTETDEHKAIVRENSLLRRPTKEANTYSARSIFLIEHQPDQVAPYYVWDMRTMFDDVKNANSFACWTRAEADELCARMEALYLGEKYSAVRDVED